MVFLVILILAFSLQFLERISPALMPQVSALFGVDADIGAYYGTNTLGGALKSGTGEAVATTLAPPLTPAELKRRLMMKRAMAFTILVVVLLGLAYSFGRFASCVRNEPSALGKMAELVLYIMFGPLYVSMSSCTSNIF